MWRGQSERRPIGGRAVRSRFVLSTLGVEDEVIESFNDNEAGEAGEPETGEVQAASAEAGDEGI